ncbi:hypothetical protein ACFSQ3_07140 [Sphingobacterium corticis]|uniref:Uncharacterized protein n=1 Tax=Sphingobacterium corticis TaxID=1812823 RepID=A0ABW5NJE0_9SPHI
MYLNELQERINKAFTYQKQLQDSNEDLQKSILNPRRFCKAIELYESTDDQSLKSELIYAMGKYVWYNYYQNLHIPNCSMEDQENERIYKELEQSSYDLYRLIENHIEWEMNKR